MSVLTGSLTGRVRDQREGVIKNAEVMRSLYDYSRKLSGASSADDVLWAAAAHLHSTFGGRIVLLVAEGDELNLRAAWPPDAQLDADRDDRRALGAAEERAGRLGHRHAAARRVPVPPAGRRARADRGLRLRAAFARRSRFPGTTSGRWPRSSTRPRSRSTASLLAREAVKAAAMQENEKVRDALLASLSHDLRTPLSAIAGAATSLRALGDKMKPRGAAELLSSIEEETARLSRFVANLLDMSRIEAGGLKVNRDLVDVADVVQGAVERSRKAFPSSRSSVNLAPDLPFVRGDDRLLEQVLFNLLDNAHKYAADSGATIHGAPRRRRGRPQRHRRGAGREAGRPREDLREILPRRTRRRAQARHRPRPVDLPRPDRVDGRHDRRAEPGGAAQGNAHRHPPARRRALRQRHAGAA